MQGVKAVLAVSANFQFKKLCAFTWILNKSTGDSLHKIRAYYPSAFPPYYSVQWLITCLG